MLTTTAAAWRASARAALKLDRLERGPGLLDDPPVLVLIALEQEEIRPRGMDRLAALHRRNRFLIGAAVVSEISRRLATPTCERDARIVHREQPREALADLRDPVPAVPVRRTEDWIVAIEPQHRAQILRVPIPRPLLADIGGLLRAGGARQDRDREGGRRHDMNRTSHSFPLRMPTRKPRALTVPGCAL